MIFIESKITSKNNDHSKIPNGEYQDSYDPHDLNNPNNWRRLDDHVINDNKTKKKLLNKLQNTVSNVTDEHKKDGIDSVNELKYNKNRTSL